MVDRIAIRPPSIKGDSQYTSWLEGVLRKAQSGSRYGQDTVYYQTIFRGLQLILSVYCNIDQMIN